MTRKLLISCFSVLVLSTSFVWAQQTPAPAAQQSDTSALEQRMKEMEERIIQLEGKVRMLQSAQASSAPAPAR